MAYEGLARLHHEMSRAKDNFAASPGFEAWGVAETVGPALAFGVIRARYGDGVLNFMKTAQLDASGQPIKDANGNTVTVPNSGIPWAAVIGGALHALSYTSMGSDYHSLDEQEDAVHMRTLGDGFLSVAAVQLGERIGAYWLKKSQAAPAGTVATKGMMGAGDQVRIRELGPGTGALTREEQEVFRHAAKMQLGF